MIETSGATGPARRALQAAAPHYNIARTDRTPLPPAGDFSAPGRRIIQAVSRKSNIGGVITRGRRSYRFIAESLAADSPVSLASRCAVFGETDLIHKRQIGVLRDRLTAGINLAGPTTSPPPS